MSSSVIVVGGGFSGLVAALDAQQRGIPTVLCEASDRWGGAANFSRGTVWAMDEAHLAHNRVGRRDLQQLVVRETAAGRSWLRSQGAEFFEHVDVIYGSGERLDVAATVELLVDRFEAAGGTTMRETRVVSVRDADGSLELRTERGEALRSSDVILATGGFAASDELCARFGVPRSTMRMRAYPWARGDGLRIALECGGGVTDAMGSFYGHAMAETTETPGPEEWFAVSQIYGHLVPVLSYEGTRVRPGAGRAEFFSDDEVNQVIGREHRGRAVLLVDDDAMRREVRRGSITVAQTVERLARWTTNAFSAPDASALVEGLIRLGVDPSCREGGALDGLRYPVRAVPVTAGLTLTGGGVAVNTCMQVVGDEGPSPVVGGRLRAVGADVGGVNSGIYVGGLSTAVVTALRATAALASAPGEG